MFASTAHAATAATGSPAGGQPSGAMGMINMVAPLLLIFVIFYFLMIRPQAKRMKQHQAMLAAVKKNDVVVTNGGLVGKVTKVDEGEVEVEIASGVKVKVIKTMLSEVRPFGAKPAND
jgi:preprotein translocase subunit YajC